MLLTSGQGCAAFSRPNTSNYRHHSTALLGCKMRDPELNRLRQQRYKRKLAIKLKQDPPPLLTHDRLLRALHYDPISGVFTRRVVPGSRIDLVGKDAGGPTSCGYERIAIDNRRYRAHRLAWFYMTGQWPILEIDHRNRIRTDNRWDNLREATSAINKHNRDTVSKNKVGLLGVTQLPAGNFRARINAEHIGVFATREEALAAYVKEKRKRHGGFLG